MNPYFPNSVLISSLKYSSTSFAIHEFNKTRILVGNLFNININTIYAVQKSFEKQHFKVINQ